MRKIINMLQGLESMNWYIANEVMSLTLGYFVAYNSFTIFFFLTPGIHTITFQHYTFKVNTARNFCKYGFILKAVTYFLELTYVLNIIPYVWNIVA